MVGSANSLLQVNRSLPVVQGQFKWRFEKRKFFISSSEQELNGAKTSTRIMALEQAANDNDRSKS